MIATTTSLVGCSALSFTRPTPRAPGHTPRSPCLPCHARAVAPYVPGNPFPKSDADADDPAKKFFTNTKAGEVYDGAPTGSFSLVYSLQRAVGVHLSPASTPLHSL